MENTVTGKLYCASGARRYPSCRFSICYYFPDDKHAVIHIRSNEAWLRPRDCRHRVTWQNNLEWHKKSLLFASYASLIVTGINFRSDMRAHISYTNRMKTMICNAITLKKHWFVSCYLLVFSLIDINLLTSFLQKFYKTCCFKIWCKTFVK